MAVATTTKRTLIDKSNATIVAVTAVAAFLSVFSIVASKSLLSQEFYQSKVVSKQNAALSALKSDLSNGNQLVNAYQAFINTPTNKLGGNPSGTGPQDGNNGNLVLDALPDKYDYPALGTSLEKLITNENLTITGITGTDEQLSEQSNVNSPTPTPVPMPFQIEVQGSYSQIQGLISEFESSIRPFQILTIELGVNPKTA